MYHYTYKITNLINNKIYYGVRMCYCLPEKDSYWGSGTIIKRAIKKYGKENFKKEIEKTFTTREEAELYEAKIVNEEFIEREDTYNLRIGGMNGFGSKLSEEHKQKISESLKGELNPMYSKTHTKQAREKISKTHKGRILTKKHKDNISKVTKGEHNGMYGKKHSKETIEKMSISHKNMTEKTRQKIRESKCKHNYIITTPTGDSIITDNLKKFCRENNLDDGHMYKVLSGKCKHHKNYTVEFYK